MQCPNPECGATLEADMAVCPHCGMDLQESEPPIPGEGVEPGAETPPPASPRKPGRKLANLSVILAIVSCPLFVLPVLLLLHRWGVPFVRPLFPPHTPPYPGVLAITLCVAPAAILTGHIAIARGRRLPGTGGMPWRACFGTVIGYLNIVVPVVLVAFAYVNKGRPNQEMAVCHHNLRLVQAVLREYAKEHQDMLPPLSPQPGVLMFSAEAVPPESFPGPPPLTCPSTRRTTEQKAPDTAASPYDDRSYFYLGYAVLDDDDVAAFAQAYRKQIAEGGTFDHDLTVETGGERRVLHRLSVNVKELWRATGDPNALSPYEGREEYYQVPGVVSADVPVLIERDVGHIQTDWDGRPRGANVLFLNAGVHFVQRGTWPITEKTQRILAELAQ